MQDRSHLLPPHKLHRLRGQTDRGTRCGGWLHELGDISPLQHQILAAAYPGEALDYIFKAQKTLTHHNTTILMKYAKLIGMNKGPDNGIRVVTKLVPTQEQQAQAQTHSSLLSTKGPTVPPKGTRPRPLYHSHRQEQGKFDIIQKVWKQCGHLLSSADQTYFGQLKASQHRAGRSSSCSGAPRPHYPQYKPVNAVLQPLFSPFLEQFDPHRSAPHPPPTFSPPSIPTLLSPPGSESAQQAQAPVFDSAHTGALPSPTPPSYLLLSSPGGVCAPTHTSPASSHGQRSWEGRTELEWNHSIDTHTNVASENNGDATPPLSGSNVYQIGELQC